MRFAISTGFLLFLTCAVDVQAFIDTSVGPGLSNCTFEKDRCEWRPYDTTYNHPMQWVLTNNVSAFAPPPKGSWFAAIEMGHVPKLTLNATFMCQPFLLDDIDKLKVTFNYFFWIDPREANSGSAKLSLKYQIQAGSASYPNHILEMWNVTSSAGLKWNTATVYYKPWHDFMSTFWFLAEVTKTNRVKFAIDDFSVEVKKKLPTTRPAWMAK